MGQGRDIAILVAILHFMILQPPNRSWQPWSRLQQAQILWNRDGAMMVLLLNHY